MRKYGKCEKNTNLQGVMKTLVNPKLLESEKMAKIATFFLIADLQKKMLDIKSIYILSCSKMNKDFKNVTENFVRRHLDVIMTSSC